MMLGAIIRLKILIDIVTKLCDLMDSLAQDSPVKLAKQLMTFVKYSFDYEHHCVVDVTMIKTELGLIY